MQFRYHLPSPSLALSRLLALCVSPSLSLALTTITAADGVDLIAYLKRCQQTTQHVTRSSSSSFLVFVLASPLLLLLLTAAAAAADKVDKCRRLIVTRETRDIRPDTEGNSTDAPGCWGVYLTCPKCTPSPICCPSAPRLPVSVSNLSAAPISYAICAVKGCQGAATPIPALPSPGIEAICRSFRVHANGIT